MDQEQHTIRHPKWKHLNYDERMTIQLRLKDGWSPYRTAKELGCASNTIRNEIKRGTVLLYHGTIQRYKASSGQKQYDNNRKNSRKPYKFLQCTTFLKTVGEHFCDPLLHWSLDACFGRTVLKNGFSRNEMVYTKTLYNYADLGLFTYQKH